MSEQLSSEKKDSPLFMQCEGCHRTHPGYDPDRDEKAEKWQRDIDGKWWCNKCTAG